MIFLVAIVRIFHCTVNYFGRSLNILCSTHISDGTGERKNNNKTHPAPMSIHSDIINLFPSYVTVDKNDLRHCANIRKFVRSHWNTHSHRHGQHSTQSDSSAQMHRAHRIQTCNSTLKVKNLLFVFLAGTNMCTKACVCVILCYSRILYYTLQYSKWWNKYNTTTTYVSRHEQFPRLELVRSCIFSSHLWFTRPCYYSIVIRWPTTPYADNEENVIFKFANTPFLSFGFFYHGSFSIRGFT